MITEERREILHLLLWRMLHAAIDRLDCEYPNRATDDGEYVQHMNRRLFLFGEYENNLRRLDGLPLRRRHRVAARPLGDPLEDEFEWLLMIFGSGILGNFGIECLPREIQVMLMLTNRIVENAVAGYMASMISDLRELATLMEIDCGTTTGTLDQGAANQFRPKPQQQSKRLDAEGITRLANSVIGICAGRDVKPQGKKKRLPKPMP